MKQRFIKAKYEQHSFVKNESITSINAILNEFLDFARKNVNDCSKVFEFILFLFSQNIDLMTPLQGEVHI
jgi:hypothetical protein